MDDIRKAILGARANQVNRIMGSISNSQEVLKDESGIAKAKEAESEEEMTAEEPSEEEEEEEEDGQEEADGKKEEQEEETEKAHIMEALSYGNDIKVTKSGKEIKAQVKDVLIPKLNAELEKYKADADAKLALCGTAPTKTPAPWWTGETEIEVPYKVYDWRETTMERMDGRIVYDTLSAEDAATKRGNVPENAEQAQARNDYNEAVRMVCNVLVDLKACDILLSLTDGKQYELTPRQVLTLGFGS